MARTTLWLLAIVAVVFSQDLMERFRNMSREAEKKGLAEPFKGVTANGTVEPGLFAVKSTGVSTEPVRKAAAAFLASLTDEQRTKTKFAVDDDEWRAMSHSTCVSHTGSS